MHRRPLCFTPTMLRRFPPQVLDYLGLVDVPNHEYVRACVLTGLVRYRVPPLSTQRRGGGPYYIYTHGRAGGGRNYIYTQCRGRPYPFIPAHLQGVLQGRVQSGSERGRLRPNVCDQDAADRWQRSQIFTQKAKLQGDLIIASIHAFYLEPRHEITRQQR